MKMADQHSPHQYPYRFFPATASTQASASVSSEVVKPLAIFDVLAEINTSPRP